MLTRILRVRACAWALLMMALVYTESIYADLVPDNAPSPLLLEEAIQRALDQQPLVQAYQSAAHTAREQAYVAAQLPDPQLKIGIINLPITGSDALRLNREDMTMTTIGLMQNMVRPVKRAEASAQLRAQAEVMTANAANTRQQIRRDVALAWLDVFAAERTAELRQRMADEFRAERDIAAAQLASGTITATELLQQDTLLAMTHDQQLMAQREASKARSVLSRWLGSDITQALPTELPDIDDTLPTQHQTMINHHPLLLAAASNVSANHHQATLADAEDQPNWAWEIMLGQRQGSRADMVSVQLTMDLPWQKQHRQQHQQAAAWANVQQAEFLAEDQQRILLADLAEAQADYRIAEAREQEHQQRLIPATTAVLTTTQAAYQTGKLPLSAVWSARRAVLAVELEHWLIAIDRLRALVRLHYLLDNHEGETP